MQRLIDGGGDDETSTRSAELWSLVDIRPALSGTTMNLDNMPLHAVSRRYRLVGVVCSVKKHRGVLRNVDRDSGSEPAHEIGLLILELHSGRRVLSQHCMSDHGANIGAPAVLNQRYFVAMDTFQLLHAIDLEAVYHQLHMEQEQQQSKAKKKLYFMVDTALSAGGEAARHALRDIMSIRSIRRESQEEEGAEWCEIICADRQQGEAWSSSSGHSFLSMRVGLAPL